MNKFKRLMLDIATASLIMSCATPKAERNYERPKNGVEQVLWCGERRKGYESKPKTPEEKAAHKLHQKKIKERRNKRRRKARR